MRPLPADFTPADYLAIGNVDTGTSHFVAEALQAADVSSPAGVRAARCLIGPEQSAHAARRHAEEVGEFDVGDAGLPCRVEGVGYAGVGFLV